MRYIIIKLLNSDTQLNYNTIVYITIQYIWITTIKSYNSLCGVDMS